jgi:hypothetical protein
VLVDLVDQQHGHGLLGERLGAVDAARDEHNIEQDGADRERLESTGIFGPRAVVRLTLRLLATEPS